MTNFDWSKVDKPVFVLAPMANITTLPFRNICKQYGADIVFTPMLSSNAIIHNPLETLKIAEFLGKEQPVIVQIFGYSPELMAKAAVVVDEKLKPAGIDINMGCPAPKITGNECGSALLKDFDKALEIVKAVRKAYQGQLSVKLRLGWDKSNILGFVKELEGIGVDAISIHGRTTKQGYSGVADWDEIHNIAKNLKIPVIGNGDITTWQEAYARAKELTGVMIGRKTLERPWIFKEIKDKKTIEYSKEDLKLLIIEQTKATIDYIGDENRAITEMRKFYGWYIKGFPGSKDIRRELMQISTLTELEEILNKF